MENTVITLYLAENSVKNYLVLSMLPSWKKSAAIGNI